MKGSQITSANHMSVRNYLLTAVTGGNRTRLRRCLTEVTAGRDGGLFISDRSPYSDRLSVKTSTESQT